MLLLSSLWREYHKHFDKAADTPGAALSYAFHRKNIQSREDCIEQGIIFLPAPIECSVLGWVP